MRLGPNVLPLGAAEDHRYHSRKHAQQRDRRERPANAGISNDRFALTVRACHGSHGKYTGTSPQNSARHSV